MKEKIIIYLIALAFGWWASGLFCDWCFATNPNRLYAWFHGVEAVPIEPEIPNGLEL